MGLVLYPATLAPATGSVTATAQCADNAYNTTSLLVSCDSSGNWSTVPKCKCDDKDEPIIDNGRQTCRTESIILLVHCDLWVISLFSGMPREIFVKGIIITVLNLNKESNKHW